MPINVGIGDHKSYQEQKHAGANPRQGDSALKNITLFSGAHKAIIQSAQIPKSSNPLTIQFSRSSSDGPHLRSHVCRGALVPSINQPII